MFDVDAIKDLEDRAARCWPAFSQADLEGWRLRFSEGVSRRANSILALEETEPSPLAARIDAAEKYYRQRGLPCRFQISGAVQPRGLDAELERRGYAIEARTLVMTAPLSTILDNLGPRVTARFPTRLFSSPTAAWNRVFVEGLEDRRERGLRCRLAESLPAPRAYAVLDAGSEPAAVGAAVLDGDWALMLCMATRADFRRRGHGCRVLAALARWAQDLNSKDRRDEDARDRQAFLQVEVENEQAMALYHLAGFQPAHTYYYRTQQTAPAQDA